MAMKRPNLSRITRLWDKAVEALQRKNPKIRTSVLRPIKIYGRYCCMSVVKILIYSIVSHLSRLLYLQ